MPAFTRPFDRPLEATLRVQGPDGGFDTSPSRASGSGMLGLILHLGKLICQLLRGPSTELRDREGRYLEYRVSNWGLVMGVFWS